MGENNINKPGRRLWGWIIGALAVIIIAAIAVHRFMTFAAQDARGRMKYNLGAIYTAQADYFSETKTYGSSFGMIDWEYMGVNDYGYCIGDDYIPPNYCIYQPEHTPMESIGWYFGDCEARIREINVHAKRLCREFSGASANGFTVLAISNIDYDSGPDTWTINNDKKLSNTPVSDL